MARCMVSPYDNRTEETRKKLMGDRTNYIPNKYYMTAVGGFYFYINTKGYYHAIKPRKINYDGAFNHYEIVDYLLTKDDTFKEVSSIGYYKTKEDCIISIERNVRQ